MYLKGSFAGHLVVEGVQKNSYSCLEGGYVWKSWRNQRSVKGLSRWLLKVYFDYGLLYKDGIEQDIPFEG